MKLTVREYFDIKREIFMYGLDLPDWFHAVPDQKLISCYNGCGSDDMPFWSRWLLTKIYSITVPAIFIHDVCYTFNLSSKEKSDQMFYNNMRKLIDAKCGWFNKLWYMTKIKIACDMVIKFGRKW